MTTSTQPLSEEERRLFNEALVLYRDHPGRPLAETIYRTGIHPAGLSDPYWKLHSDGSSLMWTRPKNHRAMRVELEPGMAEWFLPWLQSYQWLPVREVNRRVARFGRAAGIRGLCPRALRHTFGRRCAEAGMSPDEIAEKMGCTVEQAVDYCRQAHSRAGGILRQGLPP